MGPTRSATAAVDEPPELLREDLGWLCGRTLKAYLRAAEPALQNMPGGMRGYLVLAAAASNCANNQLEVARRLRIDRSVMVGLLDNLEEAGLVARKPNPTDRRERAVAITPAGRKRLTAIQTHLENVSGHILEPLTANQRESFLVMLHTVVAGIDATDRQSSPDDCR